MDINTNPFRPGAGTAPPAFAGRDELLRDFSATLHHAKNLRPDQSILATGLRGVGKTTLLNRFTEEAESLGFKVGFIEAPESGKLAHTLAMKIRRILLDYDRGVRGISHAVVKALRVFKSFSLTITPEGAPQLTVDVDPLAGFADTGDLSNDLTDLFIAVGEAARDRKSAVLIAIDEVQHLKLHEFESLIMAVHRTNQLNLPIVVVGTGLPSLPALAGDAKTYAERLFKFPDIGSLSEGDTRIALTEAVKPLGVRFTDAAIDRIVALSSGYPYFLQEWGYAAWNHASGKSIQISDVDAVVDLVNRKLDQSFFRVRLDRLTDRERRYMRAMADLGPLPQRSSDIAKRFGSTVTASAGVRDSLIAKGMLYSPRYGETAYTVPLFDAFLRRAIPETTATPARRIKT